MNIQELTTRVEELHRDLSESRLIAIDCRHRFADIRYLYDELHSFLQTDADEKFLRSMGKTPERVVVHPRLIDPNHAAAAAYDTDEGGWVLDCRDPLS